MSMNVDKFVAGEILKLQLQRAAFDFEAAENPMGSTGLEPMTSCV
jgi:hypothetical protein